MGKRGEVRYRLDAAQPPTPAQKAEIAALAALPEGTIDCSDIPPLDESFWQNAVPNPLWRPVKQQLTVRLDADVLAWLKSGGRGYQSRLNRILRAAMMREAKRG